jgi:hypothetical protein
LFIIALFTAVSITVFLLESSALFRVQRSGQPNNQTYNNELFGHNKKVLNVVTTTVYLEITIAELLSNTVLMCDLLLRFSIGHNKKQFCKKLQNILEFLIDIIIFSYTITEHLIDYKDAVDVVSYDLFVCLLVFSRLSNFSAIRRLTPLPVTGLQI